MPREMSLEGRTYHDPTVFDPETEEDFVGQDLFSHVDTEARTTDGHEVKITGWLSDRGLFTVIDLNDLSVPEYTLSPRRFGIESVGDNAQAA